MTKGVSRQSHQPLHDALLYELPSHQGGGVFCTVASRLRQVTWPEKFKPRPIDKYDGSSNLEEFIQVYHTVIKTTGGDDRVKANYLPTH
jgi:hypothetical protein